jgi:hypothetical protein
MTKNANLLIKMMFFVWVFINKNGLYQGVIEAILSSKLLILTDKAFYIFFGQLLFRVE